MVMKTREAYPAICNYKLLESRLKQRLFLQIKTAELKVMSSPGKIQHTLVEYDGDIPCVCIITAQRNKPVACRVYAVYRDRKYFRAMVRQENGKGYLVFSWHFFIRYVQRLKLKLNLKDPVSIVKHFAEHAPSFIFDKEVKQEDGTVEMTGVFDFGLVACSKLANVLIHFNTFISDNNMNRNKKQKVMALRMLLL